MPSGSFAALGKKPPFALSYSRGGQWVPVRQALFWQQSGNFAPSALMRLCRQSPRCNRRENSSWRKKKRPNPAEGLPPPGSALAPALLAKMAGIFANGAQFMADTDFWPKMPGKCLCNETVLYE
jgi:hypothetical protein